jgi:microcystin-dependent protein
MSEPFVGEIRMFAGNFAPRSWALCDGQLLAISQNDALFSLLGTIYGGDGRTTFGLPDLRGRIPIHAGSGPGLTPRSLGSRSGNEKVTLTEAQIPRHNHRLRAVQSRANSGDPQGALLAAADADVYASSGSLTNLAGDSIADSPGSGQSHDNIQPFLCVNFIIALVGVFPSRN